MANSFNVIWTKNAEKDLKSIIDYISLNNLENAIACFKKIKKSAQILSVYPEKGRFVPELKQQGISMYRELVIAPWRLIYRVQDMNVIVLVFLDSRRNVEDVLLDRLVNFND